MLTDATKNPAVSLATLLALAWPIILARATQSVIGFSDALMVAPLGQDVLAAVTTGSLNVLVWVIFPMGTAFIIQSFVAQLSGRGQHDAVINYGWYGLGLAAISGTLSILSIPLLPLVLSWLGHPPVVTEYMTEYVAIRMVGIFAAVGIEALGNWYGGLGNTRAAFIAGGLAMVSNVLLNYLLIEPRFGLPGYGVAGAAWASVIASCLGFAVLLVGFLRGVGIDKAMKKARLSWREFKRMLRFGLPNGVNWFLEIGAFVVFINLVIGHLGTTALAAFNIVMQLNSISFMPAFGLSSAGAILVGGAIGRQDKDAVWPIVKLTGVVACVWMGSVGLIYVAAPELLLGLFAEAEGPEGGLITAGVVMLMLASVWQLFDAVIMTVSEALRAAGDTTWTMVARLLLAWGVWMPASWVAVVVMGGGVVTVMGLMIGYIVLLAGILSARFASGRWRLIQMVEEPLV
ncbi:MAG: hypothetical protein RJA70_580 [Pseudomonadota bacterium]|jgi:MATE family multidrug resistance protein